MCNSNLKLCKKVLLCGVCGHHHCWPSAEIRGGWEKKKRKNPRICQRLVDQKTWVRPIWSVADRSVMMPLHLVSYCLPCGNGVKATVYKIYESYCNTSHCFPQAGTLSKIHAIASSNTFSHFLEAQATSLYSIFKFPPDAYHFILIKQINSWWRTDIRRQDCRTGLQNLDRYGFYSHKQTLYGISENVSGDITFKHEVET